MTHIPVLAKEVLECIDPKPGEHIVDATIGEGGHTLLILEKTKPDGKVLGIDPDLYQIENAKVATAQYRERVILVNDSYANIQDIIERTRFSPVHAILLDLGYSSWQLEQSTRGFSFQKDEALDMRYNPQSDLTAGKIVNEYPEHSIEEILQEYGQERFAKKIAKEIVVQRAREDIASTYQLKNIIESVIPQKYQYGRIHCATKSFQALRIAVNGELKNLEAALPDMISILAHKGRLAVISFHSLEDRIVKNFFKEQAKEHNVTMITKKPIVATREELLVNPRARSAKLRAIIKL